MHCVISSRFFFIFYFQCFHYHFEVFSTYLWLLPIYIWCHSEALFTGTWLFIWWSGHFIKVTSTSQYFINIFLWSHWASPKNGRGGRSSNLDAQHIACMCENMCVRGVSRDVLTYCYPLFSASQISLPTQFLVSRRPYPFWDLYSKLAYFCWCPPPWYPGCASAPLVNYLSPTSSSL